MVAYLPHSTLRWLGLPLLRGALSGFGLVHLVFVIHDLVGMLGLTDGGEVS
jgi:hypothetical protein